MRTLAIGDIHGGLRGLQQLLERVQITENDQLIFMGDYVDGWSESAQVISFLIELQKKHSCIFIRGNHDVWCHDWLLDGHIDEVWYRHGGKSTIESYERETFDKAAHLQFFENMQNYHVDEENRLFVHAGFTSMHGVEREYYPKHFHFDRTLIETAILVEEIGLENIKKTRRAPRRLSLYKEIYVGHTPTIRYDSDVPLQAHNLWDVDTGAAFTGKLSALDIHTKQFWQSDALPELYQNEKGRN